MATYKPLQEDTDGTGTSLLAEEAEDEVAGSLQVSVKPESILTCVSTFHCCCIMFAQ
jgi:hypothetical protein